MSYYNIYYFSGLSEYVPLLLLNFSAFFCGFPRLFVVCRVLVKGRAFAFYGLILCPFRRGWRAIYFGNGKREKKKSAPPLW